MNFLFIFLDGVGLGDGDPKSNPFALAEMPNLHGMLGGQRLLQTTAPYHGSRLSLVELDSCMGIEGLPQSATGQATLLTGLNVPDRIGYHYGPKPNPPVSEFLMNGNLFSKLKKKGKRVALLNAYPPRYFEGITSGRRIYSAIPMAATSADIDLMTHTDLEAGRALAADFTAQGWRDYLHFPDTPVLSHRQAGDRLTYLSAQYDFSFFEYWLSDYAGHRQNMSEAVLLLENFDQVLGGLLDTWEDDKGLALITSDHGNLEDISTRRHTYNPVPALLIGASKLRERFCDGLAMLADVAPAIERVLIGEAII